MVHIVASVGLDRSLTLYDSTILHQYIQNRYNGFIVVDLDNYDRSRKDIPMFLTYDELATLQKRLLILLPTGFMLPLYNTYDDTASDSSAASADINVYAFYLDLYAILDHYIHSLRPVMLSSGL